MSSKLSPYPIPTPIRSPLLKNVPETIPPTEDLEQLHAELKLLKLKTMERAKKAGEDLKTIEESMRRMKEREKGKAKAVATEKIKRERDFTPLPDAEEPRALSSLPNHITRPRMGSLPINSVPPSSSRSSLDPRRSAADDLKKKKKKRKREFEDSDAEPELQRPRKATPPVQSLHASHSHPPKPQKTTASISSSHTKLPPGPDFSVPPPHPLLPPRPPIPPPPIPGPSKPTEVTEDFSKSKQPAQILVTSFYTSIEPWIRNIREEDVGFLEYTGDEVEPYIMPKLGRHYSETWEDQDMGLYPPAVIPPQQDAPPSNFAAPVPKWDPSTLMETDLVTEERGHGPLTERVISALLPVPDLTVWKGVKAAEDAMEGRPGGSGAAAARREKMNVSDLENRIRDTMRYNGLLEDMPDWTEKVDDPISSALRQAQRELRTVVATNKARKERLASIARDRLGYQEYLELRDTIDKNISNLYTKLQRKDAPKINKKKKKIVPTEPTPAAETNGSPALPPPCPAALGLSPDEENRLQVNDQLRQLVETRRQWVDTVGAVFDEKQHEFPGRIWGLPKESVYLGIEEDVQAQLRASPSSMANKGKETDLGDAMDIG